ncbi:hypothetical protein NE237_021498 [Protea cynaroides]|uniref:Uncharacterized protein n=1 Tax=Protea cynaroides TaxID=273540 RepID=A0A9Q0H8N0_9MAGN|nr:hypothetical protein NE237_021498 [Protea cynaroides]
MTKKQGRIIQVQPTWKTTTTTSCTTYPKKRTASCMTYPNKKAAVRTQAEQSATRRSDYYNKEDGSYGRNTTKVTHSGGAFGRGGLGHKDEYKVTDHYKVGDSKGYTEYYTEERFRTVKYGNTNSSNNNNNKTITFHNASNNTITYDDFNCYSD